MVLPVCSINWFARLRRIMPWHFSILFECGMWRFRHSQHQLCSWHGNNNPQSQTTEAKEKLGKCRMTNQKTRIQSSGATSGLWRHLQGGCLLPPPLFLLGDALPPRHQVLLLMGMWVGALPEWDLSCPGNFWPLAKRGWRPVLYGETGSH